MVSLQNYLETFVRVMSERASHLAELINEKRRLDKEYLNVYNNWLREQEVSKNRARLERNEDWLKSSEFGRVYAVFLPEFKRVGEKLISVIGEKGPFGPSKKTILFYVWKFRKSLHFFMHNRFTKQKHGGLRDVFRSIEDVATELLEEVEKLEKDYISKVGYLKEGGWLNYLNYMRSIEIRDKNLERVMDITARLNAINVQAENLLIKSIKQAPSSIKQAALFTLSILGELVGSFGSGVGGGTPYNPITHNPNYALIRMAVNGISKSSSSGLRHYSKGMM